MNLLFTYPETIVDGEGIRYSIYLAGCRHHCRGCQNPESWNPSAGTPLTPEKIEKMICEINANPLLDGITFSGGDPLYHPQEFLALVKQIKEATGQNIWCYTGYTFEQIQNDEMLKPILRNKCQSIIGRNHLFRWRSTLSSPRIPGSGQTDQRSYRTKHLVLYWIYI